MNGAPVTPRHAARAAARHAQPRLAAARATTTTTRSSTRPTSPGSCDDRRHQAHACSPASSSRARSSTASTTCSTPTRTRPGIQAPTSFTSLLNPDPSHASSPTPRPRTCARIAEGDTVAVYVQDQMEFSDAVEGAAGRALRPLQGRGAHRRRIVTGVVGDRPVRAHREACGAAARGLICQPTDRAVVLRLDRQLVQPVGRARRVRPERHQPEPDQREPRPREERGLRDRRAPGTSRDGLQLRAAIFRNEKTNARMAWTRPARRCSTGKRRVDGVEFAARRLHHAQLGGLQRHRVHGRQDRRRPTREPGQHAARRGRRRGQRLDGLQAAAAAGRSAAACAAPRASGSPTPTPARCPATAIVRPHRGVREGELRGAPQRAQRCRQDVLHRRLQQQRPTA